MKLIRTAGLAALVVVAMTGCASLATYQNLPADKQDALLQDLYSNYADYRIHQCPGVIVIEQKSDSNTLEVVGERCRTTDPLSAPFSPDIPESSSFKALLGNNGELFGYVYWNFRAYRFGARQIDENTMRAWYKRIEFGGP